MSDPTQSTPEAPQSAPNAPQPADAVHDPLTAPGAYSTPPSPAPSGRTNGLAVTSLVLGIVAFVLAFIPAINTVGAFVALVGLVLGVVAIFQKRASKPLAISGSAISFVAGVLSIIMIVVYAAAFVTAVNDSISKPVTSSAPSAPASAAASDAASAGPAASTNYSFGDTVTYKDGLAITVSAPTPYTPSDSAAGADQAANIQFTITLKNGTTKNYDPLLYPTVSSNGTEASSITDIGNKVGLAPTTAVPAGQSITFVTAFSVADPTKLVLDISPGFGYDEAVFQN